MAETLSPQAEIVNQMIKDERFHEIKIDDNLFEIIFGEVQRYGNRYKLNFRYDVTDTKTKEKYEIEYDKYISLSDYVDRLNPLPDGLKKLYQLVTNFIESQFEILHNKKMAEIQGEEIDKLKKEKEGVEFDLQDAKDKLQEIGELPQKAINLMSNFKSGVVQSKKEIMKEIKQQGYAIELERLRNQASKPVRYKMKLLSYDPSSDTIKQQNLMMLEKTKKDIDAEMADVRRLHNITEQKQEEYRQLFNRIRLRQGDARAQAFANSKATEMQQNRELGLYRAKIIKELKDTSDQILNEIKGRTLGTEQFGSKKFKPMSRKQKMEILNSIKLK